MTERLGLNNPVSTPETAMCLEIIKRHVRGNSVTSLDESTINAMRSAADDPLATEGTFTCGVTDCTKTMEYIVEGDEVLLVNNGDRGVCPKTPAQLGLAVAGIDIRLTR